MILTIKNRTIFKVIGFYYIEKHDRYIDDNYWIRLQDAWVIVQHYNVVQPN